MIRPPWAAGYFFSLTALFVLILIFQLSKLFFAYLF